MQNRVQKRFYCNRSDILSLAWLPIKQSIELSLLKLVHKAIYSKSFQEYLDIKVKKPTIELCHRDDLQLKCDKYKQGVIQEVEKFCVFHELRNKTWLEVWEPLCTSPVGLLEDQGVLPPGKFIIFSLKLVILVLSEIL